MILFTIPFALAAALVALHANPYAAIAIAWFIMLAVVRGLVAES